MTRRRRLASTARVNAELLQRCVSLRVVRQIDSDLVIHSSAIVRRYIASGMQRLQCPRVLRGAPADFIATCGYIDTTLDGNAL